MLVLIGAAPLRAQEVGKGELWILPFVMTAYEEFSTRPGRLAFAVSPNGWGTAGVHCDSGQTCSQRGAERQAIHICQEVIGEQSGRCFLFANGSGVIWQGDVRVVEDADIEGWIANNTDLQADLRRFTRRVSGPAEALTRLPTASLAVSQRDDYARAPDGFWLTSMACTIAYAGIYEQASNAGYFLAARDGMHCAYITGYALGDELQAFLDARDACRALVGGGDCVVYAVNHLRSSRD